MDVRCCGKTVVRTGISASLFYAFRASLCSSSRTWACIGVRCSATPVVEIWRPQNLVFLKDLGGDSERRSHVLWVEVDKARLVVPAESSHLPRNFTHHVWNRAPRICPPYPKGICGPRPTSASTSGTGAFISSAIVSFPLRSTSLTTQSRI